MKTGEQNPESPVKSGQWPFAEDQARGNWLPLSSDLGLLTIMGSCFDKKPAELGHLGTEKVLGKKHGEKLPAGLFPEGEQSASSTHVRTRPMGKENPLSTLYRPPAASGGAEDGGSRPPPKSSEASSRTRARMPTLEDAAMTRCRDLKFSGGLTPKLFGRSGILD